MSEAEKQNFISNCRYFYREKGEMERYIDFSMEKLEEADPVIANAYTNLKLYKETFERLIGGE